MNYTVQSSEQTTSSASEMETKALLHLLCDDADQGIISNFAIDFSMMSQEWIRMLSAYMTSSQKVHVLAQPS